MRVHVRTPYSNERRLGKAYNEAFEGVGVSDWVCLIDYDVMFLTPDAILILHRYAAAYPDTGIFTCYTNRIHPLAVGQLLGGTFSNDTDVRTHIRIAEEQCKIGVKITCLDQVISGFLMMICKKTWLTTRFNEDLQCLGVDNDFSQRVLDKGLKIHRMDALYVWHSYRISKGISDKTHLL
jgi:GT2 family glycosyltransferase